MQLKLSYFNLWNEIDNLGYQLSYFHLWNKIDNLSYYRLEVVGITKTWTDEYVRGLAYPSTSMGDPGPFQVEKKGVAPQLLYNVRLSSGNISHTIHIVISSGYNIFLQNLF